MSQLNDMASGIIRQSILQPLEMDEIRTRARKRRVRRRIMLSTVPAIVLMVFSGLFFELNGTNQDPSIQFTSFSTPGPPHLLDKAISFGYVPRKFKLVSDRRSNKTTYPAIYTRSIVYQGGSTKEPMQFSLSIEQSQQPSALMKKLPASTSFESYSYVTVDGHKAVLVSFKDHVAGSVTYSTIGGVRHESISCAGPTNAPVRNIDPVCRSMFSAQKSNPSGPPVISGYVNASSYPAYSFQWIQNGGISFTLVGNGLDLKSLSKIANAVVYNPNTDNCIVGGIAKTTGSCAAGTVGSPPVNTTLVPDGGTELASGSQVGHTWALSASLQPGNTWVFLGYSGEFRNNGTWFSSSNPAATISLVSGENGQRFLFGMMPSSVTSFEALPVGHKAIKMPLLPAKINGWSFYIAPLGKVNGTCNDVCSSPVQIKFFSGSRMLYSSKWASDGTFSGVNIG